MRINQYYMEHFCGTSMALAEYLAEQPMASQPLYLPEAGSLCQDRLPFGDPGLVTGLGQRHLGDATPPFFHLGYDAAKVIDMNNLACGLTPYLPPFPEHKM